MLWAEDAVEVTAAALRPAAAAIEAAEAKREVG